MKHIPSIIFLAAVVSLSTLAACSEEPAQSESVVEQQRSATDTGSTSPGKPAAPITIDYEILGKAIVGLPVAINVTVTATQDHGPIAVRYAINDSSALLFQEGQVLRLELDDPAATDMQQVAVVPQREGRLYVNVSAEVQTPAGAMIKTMAIPIQVGSAPAQPQLNGELQQGPDGETVISMPAQ